MPRVPELKLRMGQAPGVCGRLPAQWRQRSASPAGGLLTSLSNVLHRSAAALSKNTSMAVLFLIKSTAILVFSQRKSSVTVGMFCVTITFALMQPWNPMFRYCFFCRNLVLFPVLRLFPAGRRWVHGVCHRLFHLRCGRCSQLLPVQVVGRRWYITAAHNPNGPVRRKTDKNPPGAATPGGFVFGSIGWPSSPLATLTIT